MGFYNTVLETKRLRLIPIASVYRKAIFEAFTETLARSTYPQPTGNIADIDTVISESSASRAREGNLQYVVLLKETGEFIGCAGLHNIPVKPEPGLWLKESSWKNGFGFEIIEAIRCWAKDHLECAYLYYPVRKENVPSRRIAEKLGGILEKDEFLSKNSRGEESVMVVYRIPCFS